MLITYEDIQKAVGRNLKQHRSYDIDSGEASVRTKAFFFNESEETEPPLFRRLRKTVDDEENSGVEKIYDNTKILSIPRKEGQETCAIETTPLKKDGYENFVEIAVNKVIGIDIYNRINTRTRRYIARLKVDEKPLLSFAIDLSTGRWIYKRKGQWYLVCYPSRGQ